MEKPWFSSYQEGVPHNINEKEYSSIVDLLESSFTKFSDRPAFHCMGKTLDFSDMDELSKKFASFLQNNLKAMRSNI